jgi:hypothetical protein
MDGAREVFVSERTQKLGCIVVAVSEKESGPAPQILFSGFELHNLAEFVVLYFEAHIVYTALPGSSLSF